MSLSEPRTIHSDVLIVGGGPAGIATAIAARARGLECVVIDAQTPPIDKPCGEGLLPHGIAALKSLGITLNPDTAVPFLGIRFTDRDSSASGTFHGGAGFALRRTRLHQLLIDRAAQVGVSFLWGTHITRIEPDQVMAGGNRIRYRWLVGADGQHSAVRKWAALQLPRAASKRFGFRKHFRVCPWTDHVEVHWATRCQMYVTPTGKQEVGVAVFSRDPQLRIEQALPLFPILAERLRGAPTSTKELGGVTSLMNLPAVTRGRMALVGDASGTVDAITGHGLSLSFQQALRLAEALQEGNLARYESAHRKVASTAVMMSRLLLLMERSDWIRRRTLRLFQNKPGVFTKLLSVHTGDLPLSSLAASEIVDFGWNLLRA